MSSLRSRVPVRATFLDCLLEGENVVQAGSDRSLQALRDSVRRDLEMLFNTRPRHQSAPDHLPELQTSVLTFGMPDLQTRPMADEEQREAFRAQFEAQLRRFEPRLKGLKVDMATVGDQLDRSLRFRIRAVLHTEFGEEAVVYDTMLDTATRNLSFAAVTAQEA